MDRFAGMEVFVAVVEEGGLAKAATRLHLSPPAVTRAVAALEERLGVRLLNRSTRRVVPTEAGRRFVEGARALLQQMETVEREAVGEMAVPTGSLTVSASVTLGRHAVAPVLAAFLREHPRVDASLLMLDRMVNLLEEGVDVAVRIGELRDSSLLARRIGHVRRLLVASPDYLARLGTPREPSDLRLHDIIRFTGLMPVREWRYQDSGRSASVRISPRLEVNDAAVALAAAEDGHGITLAVSYMVVEALRAGRLVALLPAFAVPAVPVHIVHAGTRFMAPKLRAFLSFAEPRLRIALNTPVEVKAEPEP